MHATYASAQKSGSLLMKHAIFRREIMNDFSRFRAIFCWHVDCFSFCQSMTTAVRGLLRQCGLKHRDSSKLLTKAAERGRRDAILKLARAFLIPVGRGWNIGIWNEPGISIAQTQARRSRQ